ncbi:undecaprenyldiphospho-muramoylpentapeptide beta-N-acetylglucosaminyltransferase [Candidatus Berkelbacteria bacterium]|nr:undecaprenyldiphospho-muramoylpentapeptide beta-N-acetylglucosaminyltransferase [Candidatus Berkelbacteria bacterium]
MKRMIVLAGGGTAGHVYPVLEVIQALRNLDPLLDFAYIGNQTGPESQLVRAEQVPFYGIPAEKLRRYWDWRTFLLPFRIFKGTVEAFGLLRMLKAQAVFCKGGYVCVPVALAARFLRIPIILHETDSIMGLSNRLVAPFAQAVAISFPRPSLIEAGKNTRIVYTGNPVRREFFSQKKIERVDDRPCLVIVGGSQGAHAINYFIQVILPKLLERYRVIHITGPQEFSNFRQFTRTDVYEPVAYAEKIVDLLAQADLVISRAGGTIFELAALGKPTILIPIPNSANNHQRVNAEILLSRGAAVMLNERQLQPAQLLKEITTLFRDSMRRQKMGERIREFARPNAAQDVATLILNSIEDRA